MEPVIQCLLKQNPVGKSEWQNLFWCIHTVCLWDEKGAQKIYRYLQEAIHFFVSLAYERIQRMNNHYDILKAYVAEWSVFFAQCDYLPMPFAQLEQVLSGKHTALSTPSSGTGGLRASSNGVTSSGGGGFGSSGYNPLPSHAAHRFHESIVRKLMLETWYKLIFANLESRLLDAVVTLLERERCEGTVHDSALIVAVRDSFVHLSIDSHASIYHRQYERAYMECLQRHYRCYAAEFLHESGVHAYMRYADTKLAEEEERSRRYLEDSGQSIKKVRDECVALLVTQFSDSILAECATLVERRDTQRLSLMFTLLDRMPPDSAASSSGSSGNYNVSVSPKPANDLTVSHSVQAMIDEMEKYIRSAGLAAMLANADTITQDCEKFVEQLLHLFHQFSDLVSDAFRNDPRFLTARDKAFKDLVNDTSVFKLELTSRSRVTGQVSKYQPESRCAELLANYCDMLLRRTAFSKRLTSDEIDGKLRGLLCLLKYVINKDVFMRYHKMHLSRRLVLNTSADSEKEENLVEWLRDIGMPADYVNKLSRMFQDIKVSNDLNEEFHRSRSNSSNNNNNNTDDEQQQQQQQVSIKILNAGAWSRAGGGGAAAAGSVTLPPELDEFVPEMEEFYRQKHSGRKLQWHHHMSNAIIVFRSDVGRYDVEVTTYQLAVLFAWNQRSRGERLSLETLSLATELADAELRRTLWSLVACSRLKHQLLLYQPEVASGRDFDANTQFWVNHQFGIVKSGRPMPRGKVSLIGRLQLNVERARDEEKDNIIQLRVLRTQEAIMRIMKMRKTIANAQLYTELIEMLKNMFLPSKKLIKEQLEWLIDNRYMRRDDNDINMFIYMA